MFARTHITGYFNEYQIPFQKRVRVTIQCDVETRFFYRLGGAENLPVAIGNLQLPPTARLRVERFDQSVGLGGLASLVDVNGSTGLLASLNMFVRSWRMPKAPKRRTPANQQRHYILEKY